MCLNEVLFSTISVWTVQLSISLFMVFPTKAAEYVTSNIEFILPRAKLLSPLYVFIRKLCATKVSMYGRQCSKQRIHSVYGKIMILTFDS